MPGEETVADIAAERLRRVGIQTEMRSPQMYSTDEDPRSEETSVRVAWLLPYLHGISVRDEVRTFSGSFRVRRYVPAYTF